MWTSRNVNLVPLYILKIIAETTIMNASFKKFRVIHIGIRVTYLGIYLTEW